MNGALYFIVKGHRVYLEREREIERVRFLGVHAEKGKTPENDQLS